MQRFDVAPSTERPVRAAQGFFGYTTFDAVQFFDTIRLRDRKLPDRGHTDIPGGSNLQGSSAESAPIPLMRYRLYQYVIAVNHFRDELYICENRIAGLESELPVVESLIRSKDVPMYPFSFRGEETSNMTDEQYRKMVEMGIKSCYRGDVFQIVLAGAFNNALPGMSSTYTGRSAMSILLPICSSSTMGITS